MNDKKKNVEMKPENHKKVSQVVNSEEITDFDEMCKKEDTKKKSNSGNSDTREDFIKDSPKADDKKDASENAVEIKSSE